MGFPRPSYLLLFPDQSYIKIEHLSLSGFEPCALGVWAAASNAVVARPIEASVALPASYCPWTNRTFRVVHIPEGVSLWDENTLRSCEKDFGMPIEEIVRKKSFVRPCHIKCIPEDWALFVRMLTARWGEGFQGSLDEETASLIGNCGKAEGAQRWQLLKELLNRRFPETECIKGPATVPTS